MRQNITQKLLALMVTLVLFSGFALANRASAWTAKIIAKGQDFEDKDEVSQCTVYIGVQEEAKTFPSPPPSPTGFWSVWMGLYPQGLGGDYRQEGEMCYTWIIGIEPYGNIKPPFDDTRTVTLSWDFFLLHLYDLKDSASLAVKLRDASDPLSLFLQEQFSSTIRQLLSKYDGPSPPGGLLQETLINELNQLLQGPSLYDEDRFAHITLSQETQQLIDQSPDGEGLIRLNRLLLDDAYPQEIAKAIGTGTYELQKGSDGTGAIIVEDMITTTSYDVVGPPGVQFFTLIFTEADSDEDNVPYSVDNCPDTSNPGQEDEDQDGVGDACDGCPDNPNKIAPGACGCSEPDTDSDGDEILDCDDNCPDTSNPGQEDEDQDGVGDACDGCPDNPNKTASGICGCGVVDSDFDKDNTPDCIDTDDDNDNIPDDTDTDDDNDGMPDEWELKYEFNPVEDDALGDHDNDGYTNLQEYLAGTDPRDEAEKPEGPMADWYVDSAVEKSGDGRTWSTAFKTIQDAINEAIDWAREAPNEIWVKQGTYLISTTIEASMPVEIYAGFAGIETQRSQRDWQTNVTAVDGDNEVSCFSVSADAIIDGFTITNGNAERGGGVLIGNVSSPTIANCTFSGNEAHQGGAICNVFSYSPTIVNCTFSGNKAHQGGAIFSHGSYPTITSCTFSENSAQVTGGAIHNDISSATITNCIFSNNQVTGKEYEKYSGGGGICNYDSNNPIIANCIFWKNQVHATQDSGGGAILNDGSSPAITNCTIVGNSVAISEEDFISGGGGILNINGSFPDITNCIIRDNTALDKPEIFDIIGNLQYDDSESVVTYCNVEGEYEGDGNIDEDPLFFDPENGDFHLRYGSPCIDAGNNVPIVILLKIGTIPNVDFEGGPRILDDRVDMGADEAFVSATEVSIGIGVFSGGTMTRCTFVDPADPAYDAPNKPKHFLYDRLIEMVIENVDSGLAVVRVSLPDLPPPLKGYDEWKWYKYTPAGKWIDFSRDVISGGVGDGAEINGKVVTLYISDNGEYDKNKTAGIIQDPSGFGTIASTQPPAPQPTGGGGGGGGCFIATAAYGTLFERHVMILRQFRDAYLLPTKIGRAFVDFYWKYSPPLADFIAKHDILRAAVRIGLAPVVGVAYVALHTTTAQKMMLVMVMLGLLAGAYMEVRKFKGKRFAVIS